MTNGDIVLYNKIKGEVMSITDDIALVKLEDGIEYSLPIAQLIPYVASRKKFSSAEDMDNLAKELSEAGVMELSIESGKVRGFKIDKSMDERIAEAQAEEITKHNEAMDKIASDVRGDGNETD